jgi:hypothetical protein
MFVSGRSPEVLDVAVDVGGGGSGGLIARSLLARGLIARGVPGGWTRR